MPSIAMWTRCTPALIEIETTRARPRGGQVIVFLAVGLLMAFISLSMAVDPAKFCDRLIGFSEWRWFHSFEIGSRLLIGVAFIGFAEDFVYPRFAWGFGCLLVAVAFGLTLTGRERHERFARFSADRGRSWFRPAGVVGCLLGLLLAYLSTLAS